MNFARTGYLYELSILCFAILLCALPVHAATNADIKAQLATAESDLIRQGKPVDPMTKLLGSSDVGFTDEVRALFFELEKDQLPMRQMSSYYDEAGKEYDAADKAFLAGLSAYNKGDYKTAADDLAHGRAAVRLMRQNVGSGVSLYPQVVKVSYTLFISDAARAPMGWASKLVPFISFLTPVSDTLIEWAANPDKTLGEETRHLAVAEFMAAVGEGASQYFVEDPVNKAVGKSFIWKSLGDAQKEGLKQEIMKRIAEDSNVLADSTLIDPLSTYVEDMINVILDTHTAPAPAPQEQTGGFFSKFLQAIAAPFKLVSSKILGFFANDVSANIPVNETVPTKTSDVSISPTVSVIPTSGPSGTQFDESGFGFTPESGVTLHFKKPDGSEYPPVEKVTDNKGSYTNTWQSESKAALGTYQYWAVDATSKNISPIVSFEITKPEVAAKTVPKPAVAPTASKSQPQTTKTRSGGAIPGKVTALLVNQFGTPLADFRFWLVDPYGKNVTFSRSTNENGRLETDLETNAGQKVQPGEYTLHIEQYTDGGATQSYDKITKEIELPSSGLWLGTITLSKWPIVSFALVDPSGQPTKNMTYKRTVDGTGGYGPEITITNSDGKTVQTVLCSGCRASEESTFESKPLLAGRYTLKVKIPDVVLATKGFDVTYDKKEISLGPITINGIQNGTF